MSEKYPRPDAPLPPGLPRPYSTGYVPSTFRFPPEGAAWPYPAPCGTVGYRTNYGGWSWARETADGRFTIRDPQGRIRARSRSWRVAADWVCAQGDPAEDRGGQP